MAGAGEVWSLVADSHDDDVEGGKLVAARGLAEGELVIRVPHTLVLSVVDLMVAPDGEDSEGEDAPVGAVGEGGGGGGQHDPAGSSPVGRSGVPGDGNGDRATNGVADGTGAPPAEKAPPPPPAPGDTLPAVREWIQTDPVLSAQPSMALAVYVLALELAGDRTAYAPYIRALPSAIPLPLFFPPAVLARLAPSPLLPTLLRHLRTLAKHFLYLLTLLTHPAAPVPADAAAALPLSRVTWPAFCWAVSVAFTRQNALPTAAPDGGAGAGGGHRHPPPPRPPSGDDNDDGAPTAMTLIPGWDMCNHAPGPATTAYVLRRPCGAAVECSAMTTFAAGDEVTIFYGHRPAADFFLHSGFVASAPLPPASAVPLDVPLPRRAEDPALPLKLRLLGGAGPAGAGGDVHVGGTLTAPAVRAARAVALDRLGLAAALRAGADWERGAAVADANEARAVALLRAALRNAIERYEDPLPAAAAGEGADASGGGGTAARLVGEMLSLERRMYADAAVRLDEVALAGGVDGVPPLAATVELAASVALDGEEGGDASADAAGATDAAGAADTASAATDGGAGEATSEAAQ